MEYKGYTAIIEYDENNKVLSGRVDSEKEIITFWATSVLGIEKEFHKSIDEYIKWEKIEEQKGILKKDVDEATKNIDQILSTREKAHSVIHDAKLRYIKEKTRARNKKMAEEKDALLNSPRFAELDEYERREDINEMYGWDVISASDRDRLEELWDLREELKKKMPNGIYSDDVTEALDQAYDYIDIYKKEEIEFSERIIREFKEQRIRNAAS